MQKMIKSSTVGRQMASFAVSQFRKIKTLEAAHHKFHRRLLGIKWYDRVSNVEVRKRTGMAKLEEIKERRLRWLGT